MFTIAEIQSWSTERIRAELEDQRRWVRGGGIEDHSDSNEFLHRLQTVLDERRD